MTTPNVLLADDDTVLSALLCDYLGEEGFNVIPVYDGITAEKTAVENTFDLILLDIMMPGKNGIEVLKEIRAHNQTPVLMLTAKGDDVDRILGLELGADDYLPKPCNPRELVARMRAVLRRTQPPVSTHHVTEVGDIVLSIADRSVYKQNQQLELTSTEFNVLSLLLQSPGQMLSKETLMEQAVGRKLERYDRAIDMHVSNLRKKLGKHADGSERIKTVRGMGYVYTAPAIPPHNDG